MGIKDNLKTYVENKPLYNDWKKEKDIEENKRIKYLKSNPISQQERDQYVKKAKSILNCVDVMDEYSQSRAEDAEMTLQGVRGGVMQIIMTISVALAGLFVACSKNATNALDEIIKNKKINLNNIKKLAIPAVIALVPIVIVSGITSFFGAKKEAQASRVGRLDAMENVLSNPAQFAILTPEQEKEVAQKAATIEVEDKDIKKYSDTSGVKNLFKSVESIVTSDSDEEERIKKFNQKVSQRYEANKNTQLNKEDIEEAKKDQQLIQNIVHKIDIKSQDYAENTELATNAATMAVLGANGILSGLMNKVMSHVNIKDARLKVLLTIASFIPSIAFAVFNTNLQKQASRVGRHIAKQELLNNSDSLVYVDENLTKNIQSDEIKPEKKNFITMLTEIYKNNSEYNEYKKTKGKENIKEIKAREDIKLTKEQEQKARQLQENTFAMFNKIDEKSQQFAESTEAIGDISMDVLSLIMAIPAMSLASGKMNAAKIAKIAASMIPAFLLEILITKEQKKASRVASMLALNETKDYRFFASGKKSTEKEKENKSNNTVSSNNSSNFQKKFKQMLNNKPLS